LKILAGIVTGFLGAIFVVAALQAIGIYPDPATIGALHIILWASIAIVFVRWRSIWTHPSIAAFFQTRAWQEASTSARVPEASTESAPHEADPESGPFVHGTNNKPASDEDAAPTDPGHGTSAPDEEFDDPRAPDTMGPQDTARTAVNRWIVLALAATTLLVLGAAAVGGFLGTEFAADRVAASTTTTLQEPDALDGEPSSRNDLTTAELVWCDRDTDTYYAMLRAVETLGFYDFTPTLGQWRDGSRGAAERLEYKLATWIEKEGEDEVDRMLAIACRAAFEGR